MKEQCNGNTALSIFFALKKLSVNVIFSTPKIKIKEYLRKTDRNGTVADYLYAIGKTGVIVTNKSDLNTPLGDK